MCFMQLSLLLMSPWHDGLISLLIVCSLFYKCGCNFRSICSICYLPPFCCMGRIEKELNRAGLVDQGHGSKWMSCLFLSFHSCFFFFFFFYCDLKRLMGLLGGKQTKTLCFLPRLFSFLKCGIKLRKEKVLFVICTSYMYLFRMTPTVCFPYNVVRRQEQWNRSGTFWSKKYI